ncbi:MAG: NirD/YgiW/YdeI family stress tolerance protein [Oxalicibacterium faecigallinarum]|uniref:Bacterial OB-fold domain-containing protein n=1 Tax=Oxalicibacterium faecigallinarum TaxID=573741 RepID=A0A8J3F2Y1_9BURK|nr:NirD/YgiW/YdeI family stress tolerance protein [Oxalicibacterium faecigallinarum]MDQ7969860.1 NirD/YgiW/YdeI family stress tolerance protein [Oxalicibacterium faecigallinarum]GGI18196.1 hypothetical protein GCM10008066_12790 [Oxalicibacterium faecigallinarum]
MLHKANIAAIMAASALSLAVLTPAQAQYTGPSARVTQNSVAAILKNPVDDQQVILRGYLTRQIAKEKYMFSDGTGEIRVDIDDKHLRGLPVSEKTKVELHGEVEKDFLESPEIDVDLVRIIQ